jgi:hypothetical protein
MSVILGNILLIKKSKGTPWTKHIPKLALIKGLHDSSVFRNQTQPAYSYEASGKTRDFI